MENVKNSQCDECGKNYPTKIHLNRHVKLVHIKEYKLLRENECEHCLKIFPNKHVLIKHRRVHTGEKPFTCSECGRSFGDQSAMIYHRKLHLPDRQPIPCEKCGKTFTTRKGLKKHSKICIEYGTIRLPMEKKHLCSHCGKGFVSPWNLSNHVNNQHKRDKKQLTMRKYKKEMKNEDAEYAILLNSIEKASEKFNVPEATVRGWVKILTNPEICSICGAHFSKDSELKKHIWVNHDSVKYQRGKNKYYKSNATLNRSETEQACSEADIRFAETKEKKHEENNFKFQEETNFKFQETENECKETGGMWNEPVNKNEYRENEETGELSTDVGKENVKTKSKTRKEQTKESKEKGEKENIMELNKENDEKKETNTESKKDTNIDRDISTRICAGNKFDYLKKNINILLEMVDEFVLQSFIKKETVLNEINRLSTSQDNDFRKEFSIETIKNILNESENEFDTHEILYLNDTVEIACSKLESLQETVKHKEDKEKIRDNNENRDFVEENCFNRESFDITPIDKLESDNKKISNETDRLSTSPDNEFDKHEILTIKDTVEIAFSKLESFQETVKNEEDKAKIGDITENRNFVEENCIKRESFDIHHIDKLDSENMKIRNTLTSNMGREKRKIKDKKTNKCKDVKRKVKKSLIRYPCNSCDKLFKAKSDMLRHEVAHTKVKDYSCEECGKQFAYKKDMIRHKRAQHINNEVKKTYLMCSECGQSFTTKNNLIIHERTHTGETPFACDVCGDRFRLDHHLDKHKVKVHNAPYPKMCHLCGKGFLRFRFKDVLENHKKKCTEEIVFHEKKTKCEICEKEFERTNSYNRHMKSHNKQKDFPCKQCGKAFADKRNLLSHTEKNHSVNLFSS